jgi:hypothetical protein
LRSHLRSNVVGYLALFVALGGTSYALKGADGSEHVIHGCFQRRSGTLRIVAASASCRRGEQALAWNREGQQGPTGAAGAPGSQGSVGPRGPAGPTVGAANGGSPLAEPDGTASLRGPTTITTAVAGSIFATGRMELGMRCAAATTYNCSFTAGLYVDGKPVPASSFFATVPNGGEQTYQLNLFGVLSGVPAGTHQVTIGWKSTPPNKAESYFQTELSSGAILLGS